jgi:tetratricopeptide (TPR) repeat protein
MTLLTLALLLAVSDASQVKASMRDRLRSNPLDPQIEVLLKTAVAAHPNDPELHYLYGQWAILNHQEALAIREETHAAALSPGNHLALMQAWTLVALAEDTLDHEVRARAAFEKAKAANVALPHPDASTLYEYAKFLQKRGRTRDAQGLVLRVLELNPALAPAHLLRAKLLESSGDRAAAITEAEKSLLSANDVEDQRSAHAFLARAYFAAGDPTRAEPHREWIEQHGSSR